MTPYDCIMKNPYHGRLGYLVRVPTSVQLVTYKGFCFLYELIWRDQDNLSAYYKYIGTI